jgi:hypothetical protein
MFCWKNVLSFVEQASYSSNRQKSLLLIREERKRINDRKKKLKSKNNPKANVAQ